MKKEHLDTALKIAHDVAKLGIVSRQLRTMCKWHQDQVDAEAATAAWHALEVYDETKGIPIEKWVAKSVTWRLTDQLRYELKGKCGQRKDSWVLGIELLEEGIEPQDRDDAVRWATKLNEQAQYASWDVFEEGIRQLKEACKKGVKIMRCTKARKRVMEKKIITNTLKYVKGNRNEACRVLGIDKVTLLRKIKEWGIDVPSQPGVNMWSRDKAVERQIFQSILDYADGDISLVIKITGLSKSTVYRKISQLDIKH